MIAPATFAAVIEGQCPNCDLPLDRRESYGYCAGCKRGWSAATHRHDDICAEYGCQWATGEPTVIMWVELDAPPVFEFTVLT